jgi:hypothetical protein
VLPGEVLQCDRGGEGFHLEDDVVLDEARDPGTGEGLPDHSDQLFHAAAGIVQQLVVLVEQIAQAQ